LLLLTLRPLLFLMTLLLLRLPALAISLPLASAVARRALLARRTIVFASLPRTLLVLADLAIHVAAGLLFLLCALGVVSAVGTTLPPFGVCALAGRAED